MRSARSVRSSRCGTDAQLHVDLLDRARRSPACVSGVDGCLPAQLVETSGYTASVTGVCIQAVALIAQDRDCRSQKSSTLDERWVAVGSAGGNQASRHSRAAQAPPADPTATNRGTVLSSGESSSAPRDRRGRRPAVESHMGSRSAAAWRRATATADGMVIAEIAAALHRQPPVAVVLVRFPQFRALQGAGPSSLLSRQIRARDDAKLQLTLP